MTAPQTYAEWFALLERFQRREKDEETLDAMWRGTVAWQSGVAERFSKKLIDAVNARMNAASDRFQRDLSHARGSDGEVVRALLALRDVNAACQVMKKVFPNEFSDGIEGVVLRPIRVDVT